MSVVEQSRREVEEAVFDYYMCWRDACADVSEAYRRWRSTTAADRVLAYGAYLAALDREQAAADTYDAMASELGALDAALVVMAERAV